MTLKMLSKACLFALLWSIFHLMFQVKNASPRVTSAVLHKRAPPNDAFDNDTNRCLFDEWKPPNPIAVLEKGKVICPGSELCYGRISASKSKFAVCYDTKTLIPDFTGHIVEKDTSGTGRPKWHDESGPYAPNPQSSVDDYKTDLQKTLFKNFDVSKEQFCSRGHVTPNADFKTLADRELTMVNTNIAPQWQAFNSKNWAAVESSVRDYAKSARREVYVLTGTGGKYMSGSVVLNKTVVIPKYYWKVICDPNAKESVAFVAENPVDVIDTTVKQGCKTSPKQTPKFGIVECLSVNNFTDKGSIYYMAGIRLPTLNATNCNTKTMGSSLLKYLNLK